MDWNNYEIFDPPGDDQPLHLASRVDARRYFQKLMSTKDERIAMLAGLAGKCGVELDGTDQSVQRLNDWFVDNVELDPENPTQLRGRWLSVAQDVSLYLAELILAASPHLSWKVHEGGKTNLSYQRPVLAGFRNVANPRYTMDLTFAISQYGLEVLEADDFSRRRFLDVIGAAAEKA